MISIHLAGPARGKGRPRAASTPNGARLYTDAKTRSYEAQLRFAAQQEMRGAGPMVGPIVVGIEVAIVPPGKLSRANRAAALAGELRPVTRPDLDNYAKIIDALNGVVWEDDRQVVEMHLAKRYAASPGLTIEVRPL